MKDLGTAENRGSLRSPPSDTRYALVHRVASSSAFHRSNRLRELLQFLCERAISNSSAVVHEQDIGVEVFGRSTGYDTAQDTLVRVQASQLRKRLQQYFASEGRNEPVIIEIPKGSYVPVFRSRDVETPPQPAIQPVKQPSDPRVTPRTIVLALLAMAGCLSSVWLGFSLARSGEPFRPSPEIKPAVNSLWRQIFDNGRPACIVLSDSGLVLFQDMIQRQLDLREYRSNSFNTLADTLLPNPRLNMLAKHVVNRAGTHLADTRLAGIVQVLNAAHQIPTEVVFARELAISYLQSHNVVLLGPRRANPWLDLFEGQLNFQTRFVDAVRPVAYFQNRAPQPGESATYPVLFGHHGYCRVAYLPNLSQNGNVLILSGTDVTSTEAGGPFISTERWVQALQSRLGVKNGGRFPYFEVLLEVELLVGTTPQFHIIAHRIPKG